MRTACILVSGEGKYHTSWIQTPLLEGTGDHIGSHLNRPLIEGTWDLCQNICSRKKGGAQYLGRLQGTSFGKWP